MIIKYKLWFQNNLKRWKKDRVFGRTIVHPEPDVHDKKNYFYVYKISSKHIFLNSTSEEIIQNILDNIFNVNSLTCSRLFTMNIFIVATYIRTVLYCLQIFASTQYCTSGTILLQMQVMNVKYCTYGEILHLLRNIIAHAVQYCCHFTCDICEHK